MRSKKTGEKEELQRRRGEVGGRILEAKRDEEEVDAKAEEEEEL